jgi:hypothetical protein
MKRTTKNIITKGALFFIMALPVSGTVMGQQQEREANLKAAFIYNFTKYIVWDTTAAGNNFVIGIIGNSPVTGPLMEIAKSNNVENRKIVIKRFARPDDITNCDILFIPGSLPFSLESILGKLNRGVLTISEEEGYAKMGTAFNFVIVNDKLKFEANLKAISSEGLKAGSQLLKLAIIVD